MKFLFKMFPYMWRYLPLYAVSTLVTIIFALSHYTWMFPTVTSIMQLFKTETLKNAAITKTVLPPRKKPASQKTTTLKKTQETPDIKQDQPKKAHHTIDRLVQFIAENHDLNRFVRRNAADWVRDREAAKFTITAALVLCCLAFMYLFEFLKAFFMTYTGQNVIARLREDFFCHVADMPICFFKNRETGQLISNLTNDIKALEIFANMVISDTITHVLVFFAGVAYLIYLNPKLFLYTIVTAPILFLIIQVLGKFMRRVGRSIQERIGDITAFFHKVIYGIEVVKVFAMENEEKNIFLEKNRQYVRDNIQAVLLSTVNTPLINLVGACMAVLIFWFGGREVYAGRLAMNELLLFILVLFNLGKPLSMFGNIYMNIQKSVGAAERVFKIMNLPNELKGEDKPDLPLIQGKVEFRQVGFWYHEDEPVLKEVSLTVESGEVLAIVGLSGAGKTTLVNLLPRLFDPKNGKVLLDDIDTETVNLKSLRRQIGIVPQESILFPGTIRDNIRYGRPESSEAEIVEAARMANAHDFITGLPHGYQTEIGERGVKISGGQRQRIAIARALLKKPKIMIFDEATSSLDSHAEKEVQTAIEKLIGGQTTFVIAHRLSTIMKASRIIVLDGGRLVESGTHQELIKNEGLYHRLFEMQFRRPLEGV